MVPSFTIFRQKQYVSNMNKYLGHVKIDQHMQS